MRWLLLCAFTLLLPGWAAAQTGGSAAKVYANGFYAEPYLTIDPGAHTAVINRLSVDRGGRFVLTGSDDKTVRVWSAVNGQLLRTIRIPSGPGNVGKAYAVAISPDGELIAVGGYTGSSTGDHNLYLFNRATGAMLHRFGGLTNAVAELRFSPNGRLLIAVQVGNNGIRLYNVTKRREVAADKDYGGDSLGATIARDGRIATTSVDGHVRLYTPSLRLIRKVATIGGKQPVGIAFSPDARRIAVGYNDSRNVDVLDAATLVRLYSADTTSIANGNMFSVEWSANGSNLIAGGVADNAKGENYLRIWAEGGQGAFQDIAVSENTIFSIAPLRNGRIAVATSDPKLAMLDANAAQLWAVTPPILDLRGANLRIGNDATVVLFTPRAPARVFAFDASTRRLRLGRPTDSLLQGARISGLEIANWRNNFRPTLGGKELALDEFEMSRSLSVNTSVLLGASFLLGTEFNLRRYAVDGSLLWRINSPGVTWSVNHSGNGKVAVASFGDGTVRWYNLADGVEQLALFVHADGERWVAWTPTGYYAASVGGENLIRWVVNRGLDAAPQDYPVGAYRDKFYRPDVIATILDTLDIDRAVQLADAARGRQSNAVAAAVVIQQAPPVVTILDPDDGTTVRNSPLEVGYRISGKPGEKIKRLRALIDNRETAFVRDLVIPASGVLEGELKVPFEGIAPVLQLYAANEFADSAPATVRLSGGIEPKDKNKPVLYVLAIGISEYRNDARLNLKFADDDARAFAARMRAQKGGLYRDVVVRELVDKDATRPAIVESLSWLQRQVTNADVAVIFLSAHGEMDSRESLFLISHDTDVSDEIPMRLSAVEWSYIEREIDDIAAKGKVLVFLDMCKSGGVLKSRPGIRSKGAFPPDLDKAVNELNESGNDVTIFSSSTERQFSLEDDKIKQGYFTYALLEALDGRGPKASGYVTTGDLTRYLAERVKKLTNGAQSPRVTTPSGTISSPPLFVIR